MTRAIHLLHVGLASSLFAATASSQTLIYQHFGDHNGDENGFAVGAAGDVNLDGFDDVLVGAPWYRADASLDRQGRVQVLSGRDGSVLFTLIGASSGSRFGYAVEGVGDLNEDGHPDFAIGAPTDDEGGTNHGTVYVHSGADASLLWAVFGPPPTGTFSSQFGRAIAGGVDVDGDGRLDVAVGAPVAGATGLVRFFSGDGSLLHSISGPADHTSFGWAIDGLGDVDGDGSDEVVIGDPSGRAPSGLISGTVVVYSPTLLGALATVWGPEANCEFGHSVAGVGDISGDGIPDFVAGAPAFSSWSGRVVAMLGESGWPIHFRDGGVGDHLGHAVAGLGDIDHDGVSDYLVGSPRAAHMGLAGVGLVEVLSGATGLPVWSRDGYQELESFGQCVSSAGFVNQDAVPDLVVGAHHYDINGSDGTILSGEGIARVYLLDSPTPAAYCSALVNSQGCTPSIACSGAPSMQTGDNFVVSASEVLNNKFGVLFWGREEGSMPFGGGTLCVTPPIVRTPVQHSGGSDAGVDCSGAYAFHFSHAYLEGQALMPGQTIYCQYWSRDPFLMPHGIGLTNALAFQLVP